MSSDRGAEFFVRRSVTLPPPAQTWAADEMLNVLEACVPVWAPGQTLVTLGPTSPKYWHFLVEAKKLAYTDLVAYNGDPNFVSVPLAKLLANPYAQSLCSRVDPDHASHRDVVTVIGRGRHVQPLAAICATRRRGTRLLGERRFFMASPREDRRKPLSSSGFDCRRFSERRHTHFTEYLVNAPPA